MASILCGGRKRRPVRFSLLRSVWLSAAYSGGTWFSVLTWLLFTSNVVWMRRRWVIPPYISLRKRLSGRRAEIVNNLGRALRRSGSDHERQVGLGYLRQATQLNPFQAYLHGDLAEALFEDGLVKEAIAVNEVARRLFPTKVLYIRRKAKYLLAIGDREGWEEWTAVADELERKNKALRP